MIIRTQLSKKDFIKANFAIAYSSILMKILTGFLLLLLLSGIISFATTPSAELSIVTTPLLILLVMPVSMYFVSNRNYKTAKRLSEVMEYNITEEQLSVKGESFSADYSWDKLFKVTKTKTFLFLFHSKTVASIIPLRDTHPADLDVLKNILEKNKVKNNL